MILALIAAAAQVVAVLEFRDKVPAAERIDAAYLSDRVRGVVKRDLATAKIITRENMLVLLQSSGRDLADCEGECEVDTGRRIGADLVVSGELLRFGTEYKLSLKLHDTRSGELLAATVATGATADDLDRDLQAAVDRLLEPLLRGQRGERRERERRPLLVLGGWLTLGYDRSDIPGELPLIIDGLGWHAGAQAFVRVAGPLYAGALFDYSFSNVEGPLVAAGLRAVLSEWAVSAGFGYTNETNVGGGGGGTGALAAIDFGVGSGFCLRAQGSWRRSSDTRYRNAVNGVPVDVTALAVSGGVAYNF
jgi:hypothetical protein